MNTKSFFNALFFMIIGGWIGAYAYSYFAIKPFKKIINEMQEQFNNDISYSFMQSLIYAKAFNQDGPEVVKELIASNIEDYVIELSAKKVKNEQEIKLLASIKEHYSDFCTPKCKQAIEASQNEKGI